MSLQLPLISQTVATFVATWPIAQWIDVTIVAAVSGGPDSTALLRMLCQVRPTNASGQIVVAHFNHRLRGEDSEADEAFVRSLAAELGLPIEVGRADGANTIAADSTLTSEATLREERYAFLLATAHRVGARYVVVGHTADDQAETVLFRLLRGTGLSGLQGMLRTRRLSEAVTLIRPMLSIRRRNIHDYLASLGQASRFDASNQDLRFARNRIRHETLPQLEAAWGTNVVPNLLGMAEQAEQLLAPLKAAAAHLLDQTQHESKGSLELRWPTGAVPARAVLREMFVELWRRRHWPRGAMHSGRWEELVDLWTSPNDGVRMFPGGLRAEKKGESLWVTRLKD